MSFIKCEGLSLGYDGRVIVEGLDFSVEKNDYLCIVGENGSGKSTLMRTVLGLQKPLAGKISFGDGLVQSRIGYLPQQTFVQKDFPASVREVVLSGLQGSCGMRPFYTREEKAKADSQIEKMGIADLSDRCYRELSGGQQQRVLLARALCAAGSLLLLDEPVSGLDPKVTLEMYRIIEELNKKDGLSIIMISHDISAALKYANRILYIGRSCFFGTKDAFLSTPAGRMLSSKGDAAE